MTKQEQKYMEAKAAYYNEQPIMTDAEFDALEAELKQQGSEVVEVVGAFDRNAKFKHPSHMGSLAKFQADKDSGNPPTDDFVKWYGNVCDICGEGVDLVIEEKLDGNAVNLVYVDGKLKQALSRGDGKMGRDYLPKLNNKQVPFEIPEDGLVEIRCEVVIDKKLFAEKYSKFANERNYVAGVLGSDTATQEQCAELSLVPVEYHKVIGEQIEYHDIEEIGGWGFECFSDLSNIYIPTTIINSDKLSNVFERYFERCKFVRNSYKYRTDGIVYKIPAKYREVVGETSHHPNWAIAIKFKPEVCITEVTGFEMRIGKTGKFTPVVQLKPVDLDGSTVSKASAYNYKFITENSLNVGSKVSLVKSGDIIPQITNVITPSETPYEITEKCPFCGAPLKVDEDGMNIYCTNDECEGKDMQRFYNSVAATDLKGLGIAYCYKVYPVIKSLGKPLLINALLNPRKVEELIDNCEGYKKQANDRLFLLMLRRGLSKMTMSQFIGALSIDGVSNGGKLSQQMARQLSGLEPDWYGLNKSVVKYWEEHIGEYKEMLNKLRDRISIEDVIENTNNGVNIILTGSPKSYGYKTKTDFLNKINIPYQVVDKVKSCDILITDDITSQSTKMMQAKKLGKKILTYEEFINEKI